MAVSLWAHSCWTPLVSAVTPATFIEKQKFLLLCSALRTGLETSGPFVLEIYLVSSNISCVSIPEKKNKCWQLKQTSKSTTQSRYEVCWSGDEYWPWGLDSRVSFVLTAAILTLTNGIWQAKLPHLCESLSRIFLAIPQGFGAISHPAWAGMGINFEYFDTTSSKLTKNESYAAMLVRSGFDS